MSRLIADDRIIKRYTIFAMKTDFQRLFSESFLRRLVFIITAFLPLVTRLAAAASLVNALGVSEKPGSSRFGHTQKAFCRLTPPLS